MGTGPVSSRTRARLLSNKFAVQPTEDLEVASLQHLFSSGPPSERAHHNAAIEAPTATPTIPPSRRVTKRPPRKVIVGEHPLPTARKLPPPMRPAATASAPTAAPPAPTPAGDLTFEYTLQPDGSMKMEIIRPGVTEGLRNMPRLRTRQAGKDAAAMTADSTAMASRRSRPPMEWHLGAGGALSLVTAEASGPTARRKR